MKRIIHRGKLRLFLVIFVVLFMSYNAKFFTIGLVIFMIGLSLHFISKGFLFRNLELAIRGPYSFTRHPFYLSNMLLDIGIIFMSGHIWILLVYLPLYFLCYHKVILKEEEDLTNLYGDLYRQYINTVPRYLFRLRPYVVDWYKGFKWKNVLREREVSRVLRLVTYPVSFLIIHNIRVGGLSILREMLPWLGIVILLLWSSYLFHNVIEWNRRFKEIGIWIIYLGLILFSISFIICIYTQQFWLIPYSLLPMVFVFICTKGKRLRRRYVEACK